MLTIFGSIAVAIMFLPYWLESRSRWNILIFAVASAATSPYSGLEEVYPIMVIEGLWSLVALQRFFNVSRALRTETQWILRCAISRITSGLFDNQNTRSSQTIEPSRQKMVARINL